MSAWLLLGIFAAEFDVLAATGAWRPGTAVGAELPAARRDLSGFAAATVRTRTRAAGAAEVEFRTAAGDRHWRKIDLVPGDWQRHELPLRWFRPGDARRLDWTNIVRAGVRRRDTGTLEVSEFRLAGGPEDRLAELNALAFGGAGRAYPQAAAAIVTDVGQLAALATVRTLNEAEALLRKLPGLEDSPPEAPVVVLFAEPADYRAFVPKLAAKYGGNFPGGVAAGHSVGGVAATTWAAEFPAGRPVLAHEYAHAWLALHGLSNDGNWLHEGLAVRVQLALHPELGFAAAARKSLPDAWPLERVVAARPLPLDRYWQATTFVGMLLDDPAFAEGGRAVLAAARNGGQPDVPKLAKAAWPALDAAWRRRLSGP